MPNVHKLLDNVAHQLSEKPTGIIDLKKAYDQLNMCTKKQATSAT